MSSWIDLTGQKAGSLVAKEYLGNSKWRCICDICGNQVFINTDWFRRLDKLGRSGCKHANTICIGDIYGHLTVIKRAEDYIKPKSGAHERQWLCRCICGREKIILEDNLKSGKSITCGMCSARVSIPEKAILFYIRKIFSNAIENYRPDFLGGKEIDVYVPDIKLGIEYDGERWHSDLRNDLEKERLCKLNGIRIIRIREPKCPFIMGAIVTPTPTTNGSHMTKPIKKLLEIIECDYRFRTNIDVDCRKDSADICKFLVSSADSKSLAELYPNIAKEWDRVKNHPLTPDKVFARSGRKAWWICPRGHSYSSVIASRTGSNERSGCPICFGRGVAIYRHGEYIGEHSLAKDRPDIAVEFMEKRNGISADKLPVQSNKKMWFKCSKCGHEWQTKVNNRTSSNSQGCPACGREKARLSRSRPIICVETGVRYESITDASQKTGINNISACCRGCLETAGGYHWKYIS